MKHYWSDAAFIGDVRDIEAARAVVARFAELRDDSLVGNVVLRAFERFQPGEFRTWWVDGNHVATTAHPDTPDEAPPDIPLAAVEPAVATLSAWFVTVDVARLDDGRWRVVEVGDGQVSDRPQTTPPEDILRHLI